MKRSAMRGVLTLAVAASCATWGAAAGAQGKKTASFTVTAMHSGQGVQVTVTSKVWMTATQARAEVKHPLEGDAIFLVTNGFFYRLDPKAKKGEKGPLPAELRKRTDNFDFLMGLFAFDASNAIKIAPKVRTETVSGYKCDVYEKTVSRGEATRSLTIWMPQTLSPRFPLKAIKTDKITKPGASVEETIQILLSNVKVNQAIPASTFAVPSGYKITTGTPKAPGTGK